MTQMVFSRYEKKYLMTGQTYERFLEALSPYMHEDMYGLSSICNIYYDTPDSLLIRRSIEKTDYKEKLRLRSYGIPSLDSDVFLEIKKKADGIVNKRRVQMKLSDAYRFVETGMNPCPDSQIHREIAFFLQRYKLIPTLYLAYDRTAYVCERDPEFRITIDRRIRSRTTDTGLEKGDAGEELLPEDFFLLESKNPGAAPEWFTEILSGLNIYPVRFSKYGNIYKKSLGGSYMLDEIIHRVQDTQERGSICLPVSSMQEHSQLQACSPQCAQPSFSASLSL